MTYMSAPSRPVDPWIGGRAWDLTWLIGSALIVPVVLVLVWSGASGVAINLGTTALVGGPHLFATFLVSYGDPGFRRGHRALLALGVLVIPAVVVYGTLHNFQVLLSAFIFTASLHVLHQNAYLTDVYRRRAGGGEPRWSRWLDYGVLLLSIYPIAAYKLVHSTFVMGTTPILIPRFLMTPATYWAIWLAFGALAAAWCAKTWWEWRRGGLNRPKAILIASTSAIAFAVPAAAGGERLELAFQAVNAWHSVQYLALVWFILKERHARGELRGCFVERFAGPGAASRRYYGFCCGVTLALLALLFGLYRWNPAGLSFEQYYYMGVLSCLLVHYAIDGYCFTAGSRCAAAPERLPYALPVFAARS